MKTVSKVISGESAATAAVLHIMRSSQWQEITPLPDDQWRVTVKAENQHILPSGGVFHCEDTRERGNCGRVIRWLDLPTDLRAQITRICEDEAAK